MHGYGRHSTTMHMNIYQITSSMFSLINLFKASSYSCTILEAVIHIKCTRITFSFKLHCTGEIPDCTSSTTHSSMEQNIPHW